MVRVCCNWSQKLAVSRTSVSYTYSTRCTRCSLLFNTCCKDGMRGTTDKRPHSNKSYQNLIWWTNRREMFSAEMILTRKATSCMHIVPCLPIHICACHCTRGGTTYQIWCHFFLRLHLSLWKTDGITCWHPSGLWKYELFRLPCHGPTVTYFRSILTITRPIWQTWSYRKGE